MMRFIFLLLILLYPIVAGAGEKHGADPDDVKIVEAEGKVLLGEELTKSQGKTIALNNARRSALEKAVGVNLHSNTLLYNGDIISDIINSSTKGFIIKEKAETDCDKDYCYARIEAYVKSLKGENVRRIKFLKASVQRPDSKTTASKLVFQNNDEIQVRATLDESSYLNVFSVDQHGNIARIYPNDYVEIELMPARKEFVFPDNSLRARGLKLRVSTPKNSTTAYETVVIVATKEKWHFLDDSSIETSTITDLMRDLSELDQSQWEEKTIGYEVRK